MQQFTLNGSRVFYKGKSAGELTHRQYHTPRGLVQFYAIDLHDDDIPLHAAMLNGKTFNDRQRALSALNRS